MRWVLGANKICTTLFAQTSVMISLCPRGRVQAYVKLRIQRMAEMRGQQQQQQQQ